jgi:hypothetical protein
LLLSAYGDLSSEDLAEVMATGFTAVEAAGRYDLEQESNG